MKLVSAFISAFIVFFQVSTANADSLSTTQSASLLTGTPTTWTNQDGSIAYLSLTPSGSAANTWSVTGTYINNAPGFNCQGTPYPLTGVMHGNNLTISFDVAWANSSEDCQSVTGWTGYIISGTVGYTMTTKWNLAYFDTNGAPQIESGNDNFVLQTAVSSSSLKAE